MNFPVKPSLMLAALLLAPTAALAAPPEPQVVGGWSEVPQTQLQTEVGAAARFGVSKLPRPHGALLRIVGAEHQVVAGINYRMLVVLKGGAKWRLQVWRKLDGSMELTGARRDR